MGVRLFQVKAVAQISIPLREWQWFPPGRLLGNLVPTLRALQWEGVWLPVTIIAIALRRYSYSLMYLVPPLTRHSILWQYFRLWLQASWALLGATRSDSGRLWLPLLATVLLCLRFLPFFKQLSTEMITTKVRKTRAYLIKHWQRLWQCATPPLAEFGRWRGRQTRTRAGGKEDTELWQKISVCLGQPQQY